MYIGADVASREKVHKAFEEIFSISPDIYGPANCAGINLRDKEDSFLQSDETFYKTMECCAYETWHCTTELFRYYMARRTPYGPERRIGVDEQVASVVNIGSTASIMGTSGSAHYTGAKHAVLGFTRTWAIDLAPYGIGCNAVLSGPVATAGLLSHLEQGRLVDVVERGRLKSSLKRLGEPRELADAVIFLLSDQVSFITGQYLSPNDGYPYT